ncbi:vWA domain-containing protein [Nonomuraea dietziae]|uniref:vWA domain-containing protein n=1 Tax=Nonomuraea dietziae TaxID=65515 RepID=UPI0033E28A6B
MSYTAEISRANPACVVFLVDQSSSMADIAQGETRQSKAYAVADAINRLLLELTIRCAKEEGVRDYFHVGVIGYGHSVGSAFAGALAERDLVPISLIADNPTRLEQRTRMVPNGAGGLMEAPVSVPIWLEPVMDGPTPMTRALTYAENIVAGWTQNHPAGFPPIVLNLSDGESTDGDPAPAGASILAHATADGASLLFNLHVSGAGGQPISFPDSKAALPDEHSKLLFDMSSVLPSHMRSFAAANGYRVSELTRGFVYNSDISSIARFVDIGTRATGLR